MSVNNISPAAMATKEEMVQLEDGIHVELTYDHLNPTNSINRVKSPKAGAVVLFAGTTRDSFNNLLVKSLTYQSYIPLALRTLLTIARSMKEKHGLISISIIHRLGTVPIGEESILIAVSAPHRQAGWRGGEETLEIVKEKVEIWKLEEFQEDKEAVWRANRDEKIKVKEPNEEL